MTGRRTAAFLCVLLAHALAILALGELLRPTESRPSAAFEPVPIAIFPTFEPEAASPTPAPLEASPVTPPMQPRVAQPAPAQAPAAPPAGESQAPDFVDWPVEQRLSARRALEAEAESERLAKQFAGPDGTWASLTKRQRSKLSKFRWRPGVDGFTYDDKGQAIYTLPNGCTIVNLAFIGCPLGKAKVHGDMFENMREYFDEQRLPQTDEGNGTEPEALRPAN